MTTTASVPPPLRHLAIPSPTSGQHDDEFAPPPFATGSAPDHLGDVTFLTQPNSPFPDGYSVALEEAALSDMSSLDHPEHDPRWPRYALLMHRRDILARIRTTYQLEQGADKVVQFQEANKMTALGALVNEGADAMTLHTKEGFRLFMGRRQDPDKKFQPIIGAKRAAAAMKGFFALSANDNPYADWALLRTVQGLRHYNDKIDRLNSEVMQRLNELQAKGLSFSILKSAEPQSVALTFKSPYGFLMAEFVVHYDYFIRVMKTAERKGRLSDDESRKIQRNLIREVRGWMEELARFDRFLWRPELVKLCRNDFLPGADAEGTKRVDAATQIFGPVPPAIFTGKLQPPHTKRRANHVTDTERALLESVAQELAAADAEHDADADDAKAQNLL